MAQQIVLGHARAVGNADQIERRRAQGLTHGFQIARRHGGRVLARIGGFFHFAEAIAHMRAQCRWIETILVAIVLGRLAGQRMRAAGAALIEQQDVMMLAQRCQRGGHLRPGFDRRLSGSAGQIDDDVAVRGFGLALDQREFEIELAVFRLIPIFRH